MKWISPDGDIEFEIDIVDGILVCKSFKSDDDHHSNFEPQTLFDLKYEENKLLNTEIIINAKKDEEELERIDALK